jgi:hypothetical protein
MRRVLLPLLIVTAIWVAGCSETDSSEGTPGVTIAPAATQVPAGVPTYQAVIVGPGEEPLASADVAPRLFRDEPSIIEVLKTTIPADMVARGSGRDDHLIVAMCIVGAAETGSGVEVYADLQEDWLSLEGKQVVEYVASTYPVRIRLTRVGDTFRVDGVDKPKDGSGYLSSLDEMFPYWVRNAVDTAEAADLMRQAARAAALEWAAPLGIVSPTTTTSVR